MWWVWLFIAAIGLLLYLFPAFLKEVYIGLLNRDSEGFDQQGGEYVSKMGTEMLIEQVMPTIESKKPGIDSTIPRYLREFPAYFNDQVLQVYKSEPSELVGISEGFQDTPADQQGRLANEKKQQLQNDGKGTPGTVEAFQTGSPSPSVAGSPVVQASGPTVATGPSVASGPTVASGPSRAPGPSTQTPISCMYMYNPDTTPGAINPIYTCTGLTGATGQEKTVAGSLPAFPDFLKAINTKDGISDEERRIMSQWLKENNVDANPDYMYQAKQKQVQGAGGVSVRSPSSTSASSSNSTSSTTSSSNNPVSEEKKVPQGKTACKPKPVCKPKASTNTKCKKPVTESTCECPVCVQPDMRDYIRKDRIPCWGCSL